MGPREDANYVLIVGGAAVLALLLVTGALWLLRSSTPAGTNPPTTAQDKPEKKKDRVGTDAGRWPGNSYDSSGVVWVPDTNQVLFVDDKDSKNIQCVALDDDAQPSGDIIPIPLGTKVEDAEDITFDGTYYYVIGSQYRRKSDMGAGIVRFKYYPANHSVGDLQEIVGLKDMLINSVPELMLSQGQVRTFEAMNIEGLGWDPNGKRLLLGFRNPIVDHMAMIVPVSLKDPAGAFTAENLTFQSAIKLDLHNLVIRSIEYDAPKGKFLIIAGAPEGEKKEGFSLWSWDGSGAPQKLQDLDENIKPEGITSVDLKGEHFLYLVGDAGYYQRLADPLP